MEKWDRAADICRASGGRLFTLYTKLSALPEVWGTNGTRHHQVRIHHFPSRYLCGKYISRCL